MTNQQNVAKPKNLPINFVHQGMDLGSKAGFRLSMLYAVSCIFLAFLVEMFGSGVGFSAWRENGAFYWYKFIQGVPIFLLVALAILFVAIGPATILGILTGMLLGKFVEIFVEHISKYFLVFSCALLCIIITILIHLFFDIHYDETYWFYMGIPTIMYVLAGGWMGWQLYLKSLTHTGEQN